MKVLVTGANGFLGRYVVAALLDRGHRVRALVRPGTATTPVLPAEAEVFTADLLTHDDLPRAFDGIESLVHLAASMRDRPEEMMRNTVDATRRLLEAMSLSQTRRMVHASSFTVYDRSRAGDTITEDTPIHDESSMKNVDTYARAKTLQENLVRDMARRHGWALTVLRPAVIWGQGHWGAFLLGKRFGPLQLVVAPSSFARLAYVENVAEAFALAVERTSAGEQIINVVDDPVTTLRQHAKAIRPHLGGVLVPMPYRLGLAPAKVLSLLTGGSSKLPYFLHAAKFASVHRPMAWSNHKLRETLGWKPRFSFEEALARASAPAEGPH